MDLKTYLATASQTRLADELGVTQGAVWQWANGRASISVERCIQIERATGGAVTCEELRPDRASDFAYLRTSCANDRHVSAKPHEFPAVDRRAAQGVA